jgi:hypothetical protein
MIETTQKLICNLYKHCKVQLAIHLGWGMTYMVSDVIWELKIRD